MQYAYDLAGNRTRERFGHSRISFTGALVGAAAGATVWDTVIGYDSQGRITQIGEDNPDHLQYRYAITYKYDANGNRREVLATYYDENKVQQTWDTWYLYDAMDRMTLSQGYLINGEIQLDGTVNPNLTLTGVTGTSAALTKTATGNNWGSGVAVSQSPVTGSAYVSATVGQLNKLGKFGLDLDPGSGTGIEYAWRFNANGTLDMLGNGNGYGVSGSYTTDDILGIVYDGGTVRFLRNGIVLKTFTTTEKQTFYFSADLYHTGFVLNNVHFGKFMQGASLAYDAAGNRRNATSYESGALATDHYTYDGDNRLLDTLHSDNISTTRRYDAAGRMVEEVNYDNSTHAVKDRRTMSYDANGRSEYVTIRDSADRVTQQVRYTDYDRAGNLLSYQAQVYTGTKYTNTYAYSYLKFDGYKEATVSGTSTYFSKGATTEEYDQNGNIVAVSETFGKDKDRTFITDQAGMILAKAENGKNQYYFYAAGKSVGTAGTMAPADFDMNYTPVSAGYPASVPGSYIVGEGDTLAGIALAVFGDATLWYLIADANGLQSDADLVVGENLTVPNRVTNLRNAYDTFKPYAPGAIIGDTTPNLPPPPVPSGGGGCGGAQIIIAIIAIIATIFTAGAAAILLSGGTLATASMAQLAIAGMGVMGGSFGMVPAMVAGAVGSIAGQAAGMALGVQKDFSWSGVAMGAIGGGVTAGIGMMATEAGALSSLHSASVPAAMGRSALSSVVTQGVGVMVGAQDHFSWAGVAASAAAAGVATWSGISSSSLEGAFARAGIGAVTSAAVRQSLTGTPASWEGIAADTLSSFISSDGFGNALGNSAVDAAAESGLRQAQELGKVPDSGRGNAPESLIATEQRNPVAGDTVMEWELPDQVGEQYARRINRSSLRARDITEDVRSRILFANDIATGSSQQLMVEYVAGTGVLDPNQLNSAVNSLLRRTDSPALFLMHPSDDVSLRIPVLLAALGKPFEEAFNGNEILQKEVINRVSDPVARVAEIGDFVTIAERLALDRAASVAASRVSSIQNSLPQAREEIARDIIRGELSVPGNAPQSLMEGAQASKWMQYAMDAAMAVAGGGSLRVSSFELPSLSRGENFAQWASRVGFGVKDVANNISGSKLQTISEMNFAEGRARYTDSMSDKEFTRFVKDIRENGFQNPVIEYVEIDGIQYVARGNNRMMAAQALGRMDELRFQKVEFPVPGTNWRTPQDILDASGTVHLPRFRR